MQGGYLNRYYLRKKAKQMGNEEMVIISRDDLFNGEQIRFVMPQEFEEMVKERGNG